MGPVATLGFEGKTYADDYEEPVVLSAGPNIRDVFNGDCRFELRLCRWHLGQAVPPTL